jgi:1-acyl-sn-glycerol-3-phosphate acyltransferase
MTDAFAYVPSRVSTARAAARAATVVERSARVAILGRLGPGCARDRAMRAHVTARTILSSHGVDVTTQGERPIDPALLVSNHTSYLDPLVVASVHPCIAIAKGEVASWPIVGSSLRELGVLFVRRGDPASGARVLLGARRVLGAGVSVLNFPEGTTSDGLAVGPFHHGGFGLSRLGGVAIVPLRIIYDDPGVAWFGGDAFVPHYWDLAHREGLRARVCFGAPLHPEPNEPCQRLALRAHAAIARLA